MVRVLVVFVLALTLAASELPTHFTYVETIAGKPSPTTDRAMIEALAGQHRERLARARAELPGANPSIARQLQSDIGAFEAELERLAVIGGGTLVIGRRTYVVRPDLIVVESEGTRIEVDPATGAGRSISGPGVEPQPVQMARPPTPLPLTRGSPGTDIAGRATVRFELSADGRGYVVLIDPLLPNLLARLVPQEGEDAAVTAELARLPGMPLDIAFDSGDFVRRITCVELK